MKKKKKKILVMGLKYQGGLQERSDLEPRYFFYTKIFFSIPWLHYLRKKKNTSLFWDSFISIVSKWLPVFPVDKFRLKCRRREKSFSRNPLKFIMCLSNSNWVLECKFCTQHYHELNFVPLNSYVEALEQSVTVFGDKVFRGVIKVWICF